MNRTHYYNCIDEKLTVLAVKIEERGKLNILDLHLHSESFYLHFFNLLFDWKLENMNSIKQNVEAIDLFDVANKLVIQVSATATKQKIEGALTKDLSAYASFSFKFISISKDASALRTKTYKNPHNLQFTPGSDIYDIFLVKKIIFGLDIERQKGVYDFIRKELGTEPDAERIETNLAAIIGVLSKEDWSQGASSNAQAIPFDVDSKIEANKLVNSRSIVDDFKVHYNRLDKIYAEFNKQGANKSISVLHHIRQEYLKQEPLHSGDALFLRVIECVVEKIQKSANYSPIPYEELDLCVNILVVDAFIRCKIFKNPEKYIHVAT